MIQSDKNIEKVQLQHYSWILHTSNPNIYNIEYRVKFAKMFHWKNAPIYLFFVPIEKKLIQLAG